MELILNRIFKGTNYTIGNLYINNEYFCDTLEDTDRNLTSDMTEAAISNIKIKSKTAIPTGTYKITLDVISPKFSKSSTYKSINGKLPRLLNVKGFDGILIHIGNTNEDTDGCILVGQNTQTGKVLNSKITFFNLYDKLQTDKNNISITIQ